MILKETIYTALVLGLMNQADLFISSASDLEYYQVNQIIHLYFYLLYYD
jgi:hypothetical protein